MLTNDDINCEHVDPSSPCSVVPPDPINNNNRHAHRIDEEKETSHQPDSDTAAEQSETNVWEWDDYKVCVCVLVKEILHICTNTCATCCITIIRSQ
jgi:hypothetical protein